MTDDELENAERNIWSNRPPGRLGAIHALELIRALRERERPEGTACGDQTKQRE
jgi:hypothetical protein